METSLAAATDPLRGSRSRVDPDAADIAFDAVDGGDGWRDLGRALKPVEPFPSEDPRPE